MAIALVAAAALCDIIVGLDEDVRSELDTRTGRMQSRSAFHLLLWSAREATQTLRPRLGLEAALAIGW